MPSVAMREYLTLPCGLIEEVIDARNYAAAKRAFDGAQSKVDVPQTPLFDLVKDITGELLQEELSRHAV